MSKAFFKRTWSKISGCCRSLAERLESIVGNYRHVNGSSYGLLEAHEIAQYQFELYLISAHTPRKDAPICALTPVPSASSRVARPRMMKNTLC